MTWPHWPRRRFWPRPADPARSGGTDASVAGGTDAAGDNELGDAIARLGKLRDQVRELHTGPRPDGDRR